MRPIRTFFVSLFCGEGNTRQIEATYTKPTPFDAFDAFCAENECVGYSLRQERPESKGDDLFSVWSGGCSMSGQRVYIREQI